MTKVWDGDMVGARTELEENISNLSVVDPILAGWYCVWIGMTFYYQGNREAAIDYFENARRRIGKALPLPRPELSAQTAKKFEPSVVGTGMAALRRNRDQRQTGQDEN